MGGKIDCYLDLASLYSYLTFLELQKNRDLLASHNVEVEFHPVLLGAINAGSGNRPPWTLPAKASYGLFDARRAIARHHPLSLAFPKNLMKSGMTVVPLRCLHYIKQHHPATTFEAALHHLFHLFWAPPNRDLTTVESVAEALGEVPAVGVFDYGSSRSQAAPGDGKLLFTEGEVQGIIAAAGGEEMKTVLKRTTQEALDKGAFGAPWLWVTDGQGKAEPFFGSDRFHFVYGFLGLPYRGVTLLPVGGEKGKL
ncbi:glutathione S-transferase kappa 1 [Chaetomidium leptoderma]|uniref:Glutathione S-transferase kappa 1 n=1 Tax=Chaetomidium leptoderma TaxID=669021 RepID=A0AAN6VUH8_9PEZI|nr:glutathione S-transferase kappa 1 [Chaetomidium leptoderma]